MQLAELGPGSDDPLVAEQVEISVKYSGYLDRQREEIGRQLRHEETVIPDDFDYHAVTGLSAEVRQKLLAGTPATRSEEHTSELQSLMRTSYAVFCLKKKEPPHLNTQQHNN